MGFSLSDIGKVVAPVTAIPDIYNEVSGKNAAKKAADATRAAENRKIDFQREMWGTSRADLAPYREAGVNALGKMQNFQMPSFDFGNFEASPGYQFRLGQGIDAINKGAGAGLMRNSGRTLKALVDYGQNMGSNEYGNWYNRRVQDYARTMGEGQDQWNRLSTLSGYGGNATSQAVNANANTANAIGQSYGNIGQADASQAMQPYNSLMNFARMGAMAYGMA